MSLHDQVIGCLNDAKVVATTAAKRIEYLKQATEVLVHRQPGLAVEFAPAVLEFQTDKSAQVRKFVLEFAVELGQRQPEQFMGPALDCAALMCKDTADTAALSAVKSAITALPRALGAAVEVKKSSDYPAALLSALGSLHSVVADVVGSGAGATTSKSRQKMVKLACVLLRDIAVGVCTGKDLVSSYARGASKPVPLMNLPSNHHVLTHAALTTVGMSAINTMVDCVVAIAKAAAVAPGRRVPPSDMPLAVLCMNGLLYCAVRRSQYLPPYVDCLLQLIEPRSPTAVKGTLAAHAFGCAERLLGGNAELPPPLLSKLQAAVSPAKAARPAKRARVSEAGHGAGSSVPQSDVLRAICQVPIAPLVNMLFVNMRHLPPQPVRPSNAAPPQSALSALLARVAELSKANAPPAPPKPVGPTLSAKVMKPFPPDRVATLSNLLFSRLLNSDGDARMTGYTSFRDAVVARLACCPGVRLESAVEDPAAGGASTPSQDGAMVPAGASTPASVRGERVANVVEYVLQDFRRRHGLAVALLYQQFAVDQLGSSDDDDAPMAGVGDSLDFTVDPAAPAPPHDQLLISLLSGLLDQLDLSQSANGKLFQKFVREAPRVTMAAMRTVASLCLKKATFKTGLLTLLDLIRQRPKVSHQCLHIALRFATSRVEYTRDAAVRMVRNLLFRKHEHLRDSIRDYAIQVLDSVALATELEDDLKDNGDGDAAADPDEEPSPPVTVEEVLDIDIESEPPATTSDVRRRVLLHNVLCVDEQGLLADTVSVYPKCCPAAQAVIEREVMQLARLLCDTLGPEAILEPFKKFTEPAIRLVVKVTNVLVATLPNSMQQRLVAMVRQMAASEAVPEGDVRLWLPILGYLRRDEIKPMLPGIVSLPVATVREAFLRITRKAAVSGGVESMTPANLVVDVLRLEAKGVPVPVLIRVMAVFYDQNDRAVYTHRVLGSALQRIIDRDQELPTLYVRAMLLSLVVFPHKLKEKIVELMRDLASPKRHVWTRPDLYRGFLECVKRTAPQCFPVLCTLPIEKINELLARPDQQVTITAFKSWMARERNLQTYTRRRPDIVSALGLAGEPEGPSAGGVGAAE